MSVAGHHVHHLARRPFQAFQQTNLVSNTSSIPASHTDSHLQNSWGITASPNGPFWISDNASGLATIYTGDGTTQSLVVTIPGPNASTPTSAPTGIVFNTSGAGFNISTQAQVGESLGTKTGSSVFMFATEDGTISGWNPQVDQTHAILAVNNSSTGAVYKGLALQNSSTGSRLYATNFNAGTVDVWDSNFKPVVLAPGAFTDKRIPKNYAPFGISRIGTDLLVTFAQQDGQKHDDVKGRGKGFVDLFDTDGNLVVRVARRGTLNAPWGLEVAPSTFGKFAGDLLVGNFGDGRINAYRQVNNRAVFAGQLPGTNRRPLSIDGLWGLSIGNNGKAGASTQLFFTAGPNDEKDGLFGTIAPTTV
jgi:uncharacterized protein (TIGR03118 family)